MRVGALWVPTAVVGLSASRWMWNVASRSSIRDRVDAIDFTTNGAQVGSAPIGRWCEARLRDADISMHPRDAVVYLLIAASAGAVCAGAVDVRFSMLVFFGVLIAGPVAVVSLRGRAQQRATMQLPSLLRRIASELRAGGTVATALPAIAAEPRAVESALLLHEIRTVNQRVAFGGSVAHSLAKWAKECSLIGVRAAAGSLTLALEVGGPAADALDGLASSLAARSAAIEETRAQSAQARASALVMIVAPIGYLVFSASIDQRSADVLFGTSVGRVCLAVGVLLDALAALWIRYLLRDRFAS